ncbi:DUF4333 domain-containing protein [Streptomyces sp. NPDC048172]|uniref:DUF4333 domain-containing protein n=1 Tax=Streptomyces sp. NPDC048172 TaxID=3365505 RepID=UPI00370FBAB3
MKRIVIALAVAAVLAGVAITGWQVLDNTSTATVQGEDRTVPRDEVAQKAKDNFARPIIEEAPDKVSCPRGLRAKVYDHVRCTATFGDERKTLIVSVTNVDGDRVTFDYGVEEKETEKK